MASIRKRGNNYQVRIPNGFDHKGKRTYLSKTFIPDVNKTERQNKKALELFALEFEKEVQEGKYLGGNNMTFAKFIDLWKKDYCEKNMAVTTLRRTTDILERDILPYFSSCKLTDIKPISINTWIDKLKERGYMVRGKRHDYSQSSLLRIFSVMSSALSNAVYWQLIETNPCKRVRRPKVEKNIDVKHFTVEEAIEFLEYIKEPYTVTCGGGKRAYKKEYTVPFQLQVFFHLALYGGFRKGEMIALNWNDIDFKTNTISITKSIAYDSKQKKQILKEPKNKTSIREVTVPKTVMQMLKELKFQKKLITLTGDGFIFTQDNGQPMDLKTPYSAFIKIIRRYNKEHETKLPEIPLHGLRHTSATLLISQNIDIKEVSSRLGHADTSTTLNIYTHALRKRDEEASNKLEELLQKKA